MAGSATSAGARANDADGSRGTPRGPGSGRPAGTRARRLANSAGSYRLLVFVLLAVSWQVFANVVGGVSIPTFTGTVAAFFELVQQAELWTALVDSNIPLLIGFVTALVIGIPTGLALGRARRLEAYADVYLTFLLVTPMAAIFPLFIIAFGLGRESMILTVTIFAIVVVIVNARSGIRQVDPSLIEMARCFGAGEATIWRSILLPAALPAIMTGIRIGLGRAFTGVIVVELLLIPTGIGGLILYYRGRFQAELLYAAVIVVIIEALLLFTVAKWVERRMSPWRTELQRDTQA